MVVARVSAEQGEVPGGHARQRAAHPQVAPREAVQGRPGDRALVPAGMPSVPLVPVLPNGTEKSLSAVASVASSRWRSSSAAGAWKGRIVGRETRGGAGSRPCWWGPWPLCHPLRHRERRPLSSETAAEPRVAAGLRGRPSRSSAGRLDCGALDLACTGAYSSRVWACLTLPGPRTTVGIPSPQ
jgi:hypothetical protein